MKKYKPLNNRKGMTLIEVIVSIAVVGILATFALPLLSSGLIIAVRSGDNTKVAMNAQGVMEGSISGLAVTDPDPSDDNITLGSEEVLNATYDATAATVTVRFSGSSSHDAAVSGQWLDTDTFSDKNQTDYTTFLPDASEAGGGN